MTDSLVKIYYENEQEHANSYAERFKSPSSVRLPFGIRQFNHEKEFPAFFCYNQDVVLSLEKVYSNFLEFLKLLPQLTPVTQNQFSLSCITEEVHSTSEIEGIHSTHRELREILDGSNDNEHFSSIIKMYDLLSSGEYPRIETCEDVRNFYDEFAHKDAIANNPKNQLDGKLFRRDGVDVNILSGKMIHRGLEPEEKIISYMSSALAFLNSEEYPALIRIAVFHYLFVYMHPFYDRNGRTARFISSSYIAQHLHSLVGLRLSGTIKKNKRKYYKLLKETNAEINCGELTPFICGFLEFILETLSEINRKLRRKLLQIERMKQRLFSILPKDEEFYNIAWSIIQASVFYGRGAPMSNIMVSSGRARNTIKSKLSKMPVRVIVGGKRKFYKIDWKTVRHLL